MKQEVELSMSSSELLSRAIINNLIRYDREYHSYLAYYIEQNGEGAVQILKGIIENLLVDFTLRPGSEAERYLSNV